MPYLKLETERLLLRPPDQGDVAGIVAGLGDFAVSRNLSKAPHPYLEEHAHQFLARQDEGRARGSDFSFAIVRRSDGTLMGMCGVHLRPTGFEMGYWLGRLYWKQGFATEAAGRVLVFAFHDLKANNVWAGWYHDNPASGRVLEKLGFRPNGADQRDCLARGHTVYCNLVTLSAEDFRRKRAA